MGKVKLLLFGEGLLAPLRVCCFTELPQLHQTCINKRGHFSHALSISSH